MKLVVRAVRHDVIAVLGPQRRCGSGPAHRACFIGLCPGRERKRACRSVAKSGLPCEAPSTLPKNRFQVHLDCGPLDACGNTEPQQRLEAPSRSDAPLRVGNGAVGGQDGGLELRRAEESKALAVLAVAGALFAVQPNTEGAELDPGEG